MGEFEAQELQLMRWDQVAANMDMILTLVTIYLTIVFAYLAAAYFGGRKLSRFQAATLSSIFTAAALFTLYQLAGLMLALNFWGHQVAQGYRSMAETFKRPELLELAERFQQEADVGWEEVVILSLGTLGVVACLIFMWSVRRQHN
jgi:hypothetical protein